MPADAPLGKQARQPADIGVGLTPPILLPIAGPKTSLPLGTFSQASIVSGAKSGEIATGDEKLCC